MKNLGFSRYKSHRIALTALAFLGIYMMCSSLLVGNVWAVGIVTKLTFTMGKDDVEPQIDGGYIVWSGWDGSDYEIFYSEKQTTPTWSTPTSLTNNNFNDTSPKIRNGKVVWYGEGTDPGTINDPDSSDCEIFHADLTVTNPPSSIQQITVDDHDDWYPVIDENGIIAWMGMPGNSWVIYWYDGIIHGPLGSSWPANARPEIDNGKIAWMTLTGGPAWVTYYFDTSTMTAPIMLSPWLFGPMPWPQIDEGIVVWEGVDPINVWGDSEIWMYDSGQAILPGTNPKPITNNNYNDGAAQIDDGEVVWQGWDTTAGVTNQEIFHYDVSTQQVVRISANQYPDVCPQIDGGHATWMAMPPGAPGSGDDWEIWYWDTATLAAVKLHPLNKVDDIYPQIWDGVGGVGSLTAWIVWQRWWALPPSQANWEIYVAAP